MNAMGLTACYILKDSFNSFTMMYLWILHKLSHFINKEGDVRPSERQVLESSDDLSVQSGIRE